MTVNRWGSLLASVGILATSSTCRANEPTVPLRVEITGTSDCETAEAFFGQLEQRTAYARRARDGELGWSASVNVKAVGTRRLARLKLMATEGEWIERELVAPNCDDALEALAVVLAVLVDTAVEQMPPEEEPVAASRSRGATKPVALPRVATGVYIPWIDDPDFFEKRGVSLSATRFVPRLIGGVMLDTQLAQSPTVGLNLGFEIERWSANMLRPSFGLVLGWATADFEDGGAAADFHRWSLRAHVCPFELLQSRTVTLRPCGALEAGFVYVSPTVNGWSSRDSQLDFVRASPFLRFTLTPTAGAQLRLDGGLDLLVRRHDIRVAGPWGEQRVYSPRALGPYAALSVAVEY